MSTFDKLINTMRADRLLSIMMLLQARGQMSARELAEELEVSKRTIYRDVDALSFAGVPIYTQPGSTGGIILDEDYRVSLTGLDKTEVLSLFISGKTGPLQDLGFTKNVEDALLKLFTALPSIHRSEVEWMQHRVHIDPSNWFQVVETVPFFPVIHQAVWENRIVEGTYQHSDGELIERTLEAYGLVAKINIWYLVGRKPDGEFRSYRIFRFKNITLTDRFFERIPDFNLGEYWKNACRKYEEQVAKAAPPCSAQIRVHPSVKWYFDSAFIGKFEQIDSPDSSGWLTLNVSFNSIPEAKQNLAWLGSHVEVLEPVELRQEITENAKATLRSYEGD